MLSENREESESLGWSSPTHCFSPLKGIFCHLSVGQEIVPAQTNRPCVNILWYFHQWGWCFLQCRQPCRMCHSTGEVPRLPHASHSIQARLSLGPQDCLPEKRFHSHGVSLLGTYSVWTWTLGNNRSSKNNVLNTLSSSWVTQTWEGKSVGLCGQTA